MTLHSLASRLYARWCAKARERETIRHLCQLDDRTLRDIGVLRHQIVSGEGSRPAAEILHAPD